MLRNQKKEDKKENENRIKIRSAEIKVLKIGVYYLLVAKYLCRTSDTLESTHKFISTDAFD